MSRIKTGVLMKKRSFLIFLGLLLLFNVTNVLAVDPITPILRAFNGFNIITIYESYDLLVESLFYLIVFVSLGVYIAKREGSSFNNRPGITLFVTIGIALAIATMYGAHLAGITFRTMSPYLVVLLMLFAGFGVFKGIRALAGDAKNGYIAAFISSCAILISYYMVERLSNNAISTFFEGSNDMIAWLPSAIVGGAAMTALISGILMLTSLFKGAPTGSGPGVLDRVGDALESGRNFGSRLGDILRGRGGDERERERPEETPPELMSRYTEQYFIPLRNFIRNVNVFSGTGSRISVDDFNNLMTEARRLNGLIDYLLNDDPQLVNLSRTDEEALFNLLMEYAATYERLNNMNVV
jgi:hypothetical protein